MDTQYSKAPSPNRMSDRKGGVGVCGALWPPTGVVVWGDLFELCGCVVHVSVTTDRIRWCGAERVGAEPEVPFRNVNRNGQRLNRQDARAGPCGVG
eukprot:1225081-Prymnesium_polylepis.1